MALTKIGSAAFKDSTVSKDNKIEKQRQIAFPRDYEFIFSFNFLTMAFDTQGIIYLINIY